MVYIAVSSLALTACIAVGTFLAQLVARRAGRRLNVLARVMLSLVLSCAVVAVVVLAYTGVYYHADEMALQARTSSSTVEVTCDRDVWCFDGPGDQTALVFLPGAKVESIAYAPLMHRLAAEGMDCFLVDPALHMAFLGVSQIDACIAGRDYETWLVGGHSLGGTVAASYATDHAQDISGVILLASYPTKPLPDSVDLILVAGTRDEVLNREAYGASRDLWPGRTQEIAIEGGNHSGYGCYGPQRGDGAASISANEQQRQTAAAVREFVGAFE